MQRYACQNETMKAESCAEGIVKKFKFGVPYGNRTRVTAVKGRCPRPLDERDADGELFVLYGKRGTLT